ncbi:MULTISPECIES: LPS-assembly lipoprotein LptE [Vibrio]|uniref:LPS-assembly lipoprotein LptE n=3 Tax=Vibrio cyclitrophicus TaxID=47951 RepID=A0A7Z1MK30_9VIBR|nr:MULTISPECIES: LPS assembly lipoprotein LptE [Vibrio]KNH12121.1 luciferase [Vibrio lentus]ERM61628.1 LPS-assembly lipoprotein RlpB precursor (Rare lipoprotein B) [Vibrio cyclitrophicus FF75]KAA8598543.1 LPS-assembly lipoprotein LptE [Vibrio cyclitrophicus]MBE8555756.1 luciferase [Vibrio sp. OPT24]MBE8607287.1 luciferase [Vibrio sp. OPT10]|tara:strand:- start:871 stop:1527 length:657 start_codon:yes stop_codon:yes gene_type:complete
MRLISLSSLKVTIVILTVSLLSACGFHLRGDYSVPEELNKISVTSYDQYSTFTRMMKGQLRMNDVEIIPPAGNTPNLHIISESVSERTLSLYQNTRAAEKELTFRARYRVTIPELGDKTFSTSVTRSYLDNPLTALAKSVERDMIEDEMRKLATSQILRQMARLKANIAADNMDLEALEHVQVKELEKQYNIKNIEIEDAETVPTSEEQSTLSESAEQ